MEKQKWPNTFVTEDKHTKHYPGSHWEPFFDGGVEELFSRLRDYLQNSRQVTAYADLLPAPRPAPSTWLQAVYRAWPDHQAGMQFAVVRNKGVNEVKAFFPFTRQGTQYSVVIDRVVVFDNGIEAQLEVSLEGIPLIFFDFLYATNRAWYEAGETYQFILTGIAYECYRAENEPINLDPPPEWLRELRLKGKSGESGKEPDDPMIVHVDGMASFLTIETWDRDDYSFHGPVREIKKVEILDQQAWLLKTTIIRDVESGQDIDLDILVTRRVWGDQPLPEIGRDIEGALWLQGHLWHPGPVEME